MKVGIDTSPLPDDKIRPDRSSAEHGPIRGSVIWITGLSGAGKTTLAQTLVPLIAEPTLWLDGDMIRQTLASVAGGYSRAERLNLAYSSARLCRLAAEQGLTVVCSIMAMFHEVRAWNRENLPGYFEVFLDMSEEVRLARDYKKVYQQSESRRVTPVVGRQIPPEYPERPHLRLSDPLMSPEAAAGLILSVRASGLSALPAGAWGPETEAVES